MTLPASGQIGFSTIATELGLGNSNLSVRSLATNWSLTSPDNMSDFYGLSAFGVSISAEINDSLTGTYKKSHYTLTPVNTISGTTYTVKTTWSIQNNNSGNVSNVKYKINSGSEVLIGTVTGFGSNSGIWTSPTLIYTDTLYVYIEHNKTTGQPCNGQLNFGTATPVITKIAGTQAISSNIPSGNYFVSF